MHVEIGLPDEKGRVQIFKIHTRKMREHNQLAADVSLEKLATLTKNFTGADIESLVGAATSFALYTGLDVTKDKVLATNDEKELKVCMHHFERALEEVKPTFGVAEDDLKGLIRGGIISYNPDFEKMMGNLKSFVNQVESSTETPVLSVLLEGPSGVGKTAVAAKIALESGFPYIKLVSPESFVGASETFKANGIARVFEDAYKSPLSLVIVDNIERLLEYVPIGPRFSNIVLQTLMILCKRPPPKENRKLLIIGTTTSSRVLDSMQLRQAFNVHVKVPQVVTGDQVVRVLEEMKVNVRKEDAGTISLETPLPIPIKTLMMVAEMSRQNQKQVTASRYMDCCSAFGLEPNSIGEDVEDAPEPTFD